MQNYDWHEILRRALASGQLGANQNLDGSGGQYSQGYSDPLTGLLLSLENGRVLASTNDVADPSQGETQTWDITNPSSVGDSWHSTPRSLGGMLGDLGKDLAPLALTALGANYLGPMFGTGAEGALTGGGYTGTSLAGATGGMTPASLEASLYGTGGTVGGGGVTAAGGGVASGTLASNLGGVSAVPGAVAPIAATGALPAATAGSLGLGAVPAITAGGGLLSGLGTLGTAASLLGAAAGAQPQGGGTTTNQRTLDPRVDAIFGGLLGDAKSWYDANKSGQNDTMRLAQSNLQGLLGDPRLMEGLYTQGGRGIGMMQGGVAANPFTRAGFTGTNWGG